MQHEIDTRAGALATGQAANVAVDEGEIAPGLLGHQALHLLQIGRVAGQKIIQTRHLLAIAEQRFQQVGADKASHARDQPVIAVFAQVADGLLIRAHGGRGDNCHQDLRCRPTWIFILFLRWLRRQCQAPPARQGRF